MPKRAVEARFDIWNGSHTFVNGSFGAQSVDSYFGRKLRAYSGSCVKSSMKSRTLGRLASGVREAELSCPDSRRAQSNDTLCNAGLVSNICNRNYHLQT
jgi:hypothetical protein